MSTTALILTIIGQIVVGVIFAFWETTDAMETIIVERFGEDFQMEDAEPYLAEVGFSALTMFMSELNRILMALAVSNVVAVAAARFL